MLARCPRCGTVRDSGIRYCTVCNYDFVLATGTAPRPAAPPPAAPPQAGQPQPGVTPLGGPERRYLGSVGGLPRRVLVIGLVIDVLIVVLVILLLGHRL
jgi:hypothetical protein